jgi:dethiobiotin synthetase
MKFFITGTDTGVGKTALTAMLAGALQKRGEAPIALKPVCCGDRADATILRSACADRLSLEEVNPFWFPEPLAPEVAAHTSGRFPHTADLLTWYRAVASSHESVLVEGAGGWLVPSAPGETLADFASAIGIPVLIVVLNRLGCLNHALLTLQDIRRRGLPFAGFVVNDGPRADSPDLSRATNLSALERASGERVLFHLTTGATELPSGCL